MASALFYCGSTEEYSVNSHNHQQISDDSGFLEACFLCQKSLAHNRDIFMYRGDKAFCSDECRQEQIDWDEAKERRRNVSARALRKTATAQPEKQSGRSTVAGAVSVS